MKGIYKPCLTENLFKLQISKKQMSYFDDKYYFQHYDVEYGNIDVIIIKDDDMLNQLFLVQIFNGEIYYLASIKNLDNINADLSLLNYSQLTKSQLIPAYNRGTKMVQILLRLIPIYMKNIKNIFSYDFSNLDGMDLLLIRKLGGKGSFYENFGFKPAIKYTMKNEKICEYEGILINSSNKKFYLRHSYPYDPLLKNFIELAKKFVNYEIPVNEFKLNYLNFVSHYKFYFSRSYILHLN